jgi:sugar/nucleoside kinase (ribokinase family)
MQTSNTIPFDYLVIGHITQDMVEGGILLGGTASYAALTAQALDLKTSLITSCPKWLPLPELASVKVYRKYSQFATKFENKEINGKRSQFVHQTAAMIGPDDIPPEYLQARIVHLGPVAGEVYATIVDLYPDAFIGITPQGWMREWKMDGAVHYRQWPDADKLLERADAVALSIEDLYGNEDLISEYAQKTRVLAVTEGAGGARIYWNGDVHHISAPEMDISDPTGAGDIFAAVFISRLFTTKDPWKAGEQAVQLASLSVTRFGLAGIPTKSEIKNSMVEIIKG